MSSVDYLAEAATIEAQIIADRRHLHANPELGFDCPQTAAYIRRRLDEMGVRHVDCGVIDDTTNDNYEIAGFGRTQSVTGVVGLIGDGEPCFMLRADMDALPLQEYNDDIDFRSRVDGRMHACGHDSHVAMLLGAAQLLKNHEAQLRGTVKLMFQTGEEWGCGAKLMIDDGLLDNPTVSAAFGLHVNPSEDVGRINVHPGTFSASMDTYIVTITGRGGHSSEPQRTIDPVMIATQLYTQLNLMFTREVDATQMTTFTVGAVRAGTVTNIIPETARLDGNMRSLDPHTRARLCERIPEMIDGIVKAWRGTHVTYDFHTPSTWNDPELTAELVPFIDEILPGRFDGDALPGTEDFSYISQAVPSLYCMLGTGRQGWPYVHTPDMHQDESAFKFGAALHAHVATSWLARNAG